jgi:hypothetical protein
MKALLLALIAAAGLTGCATHSPEQIAAVRSAGVRQRTLHKLEHRGVLTPEDLIELRARGVSDNVAVRQLDEVGVDYAVQGDEIARLRRAGVSVRVRNALAKASDEFVRDRYHRRGPDVYFGDPYYFDDGYYGGYYGGYPWYGSYGVVSIGHGHWGGGHHRGGGHGHGGRHR